ncbi:class I SAM-dependent methyltransferase [Sulfolobus acidocaldarius]|uniref:Conserved protein n=4 Tax=Sulfolobus acidocaldarius TaxID=2285 RepID=Q4JCL9_SULAC|nr:methyltransferase domain-containing protein [Sulfolobus acidocaldarius]AAY79460.1 conserved protein [Sulfolobus acidocaldarius DSM 639]AGE70010.1 hypothetical protein SacN8_00145 [Sulfolobus acidocaldarius N8]AGE72285.1 hypothetical protein SacRon12I_00145 [Sulfolobus acidocaldarius Ron12/I]ALU29560.1 methyltransferase [Sulfolobus acidocaldarius]ALU32290.1 methyltransferase [Sulfolobus acidocaldarius]
MKCIKVHKDELNKVIKQIHVNPFFKVYYSKDYAYIPVYEEISGYDIIECNPPRKTPKLNEIINGVRSYYVIGDIALVTPKINIDKELLAKTIMETNPRIKSVFIRKKVKGELRVNQIEFAGGENKTQTIYKENGLKFLVDINKVYVNPSMSNERQKIVNEIECGKIVDLFTGYGAIAIHLARKCGYIVAGDLNLEGLLLLKESINYNKLKGEIDVVNYDAKYLPFRDKTFDLGIADNPTIVSQFKEEICRVCKEAFFYILAHSTEEASNLIGLANWVKVNDYSKDLFIFKGRIRCQ